MKYGTLVLVAGLAFSGCGVDPEAPQKCEDLRDQYCEAVDVQCAMFDEDQCLTLFDETIICDDAVGVDSDYTLCLDDIAALDECPGSLPDSCQGALYFEPEPE